MVTTTYHTSSSDSSLISHTDKEVIYKKKRDTDNIYIWEGKKEEEKERERGRDNSLTQMILLQMTLEQWDVCWSAAMEWISVSSTSSPQRLRTLKQR